MEHNNQHIIKKSYAKPVIEEVMIDVAISLQAPTDGETTDPGGGTDNPDMPTSQNPYKSSTDVDYGSRSYEPARAPFGDGPSY